MPSITLMAILLTVSVTSGFTFLQVSAQGDHMQMGDSMNVAKTPNNQTSPLIYDIPHSNVQVMLSWVPEIISIDEQPTKFTIEFLDVETGQRLENITYSVHMTVDGRDLGHGHESTAADGIATMEQEFSSVGTLDMVVEVHSVGGANVNQFAQFRVAVTPELPVAAIALAAGVAAVTGLSILGRQLL